MNIIYTFAIILFGAGFLGTLFAFLKLPIILSYICAGFIAGPLCFELITEANHIKDIGEAGIIFLLFIMGMNLPAKALYQNIKGSILHMILSLTVFGGSGAVLLLLFGFSISESILGGVLFMFSSTVLAIKLIPTTALHHQRIGVLITRTLLIEDLIAIVLVVMLEGTLMGGGIPGVLLAFLSVSLIATGAFLSVKYIIIPLFIKFDTIQEYLFIISLGWCFAIAALSHLCGGSLAIGAFIAGISLGNCPISMIISEHIKPLREFFLILFFFSIGCSFNFPLPWYLWLGAIGIGFLFVFLKPWVLGRFFMSQRETPHASRELGWRLGQLSEFSLILGYSFAQMKIISPKLLFFINIITLTSFILSILIVVKVYPTPIGLTPKTRRD